MWTREKTHSVIKGGVIAAAGAALASLSAYAASLDLGMVGPLVGAILSASLNALRLWTAPKPKPAEEEPAVEGESEAK